MVAMEWALQLGRDSSQELSDFVGGWEGLIFIREAGEISFSHIKRNQIRFIVTFIQGGEPVKDPNLKIGEIVSSERLWNCYLINEDG